MLEAGEVMSIRCGLAEINEDGVEGNQPFNLGSIDNDKSDHFTRLVGAGVALGVVVLFIAVATSGAPQSSAVAFTNEVSNNVSALSADAAPAANASSEETMAAPTATASNAANETKRLDHRRRPAVNSDTGGISPKEAGVSGDPDASAKLETLRALQSNM